MELFNLVRKLISGSLGFLLMTATFKAHFNGQDWEFLGFLTIVLLIMSTD